MAARPSGLCGWTPENVDDLVEVVDGNPQITVTEDLPPELLLNAPFPARSWPGRSSPSLASRAPYWRSR